MSYPDGEKCRGTVRAVLERLEDRRLLSATMDIVGPMQQAVSASVVLAASTTQPSVVASDPVGGSTGVVRDVAVTVNLSLPNGGLNQSTVIRANVSIVRANDNSVVPSVVNTTGGNDSIILTPLDILDANTTYTFKVTAAVKDVTGAAMVPFTMSFTTGTDTGSGNLGVAFQKVPLPTTTGIPFTCVRMGPDGKLYASSEDGRILRYTIAADGTLGLPEVITSLQRDNLGQRLVTGFAFDPRSTPTNPIIWVSNGVYGFTNIADFTGKLTVMSGANLQTVQDALINLPRAISDHLNEQPTFGPDGALYFCQGSISAMGGADNTWGNRPEHLLNAAILRLDITKITPGQPLDVKTIDAGGSYNPFASGAPLTLYATGVRNAFSLLWSSDGTLWAPTNGSSSGGNTPGFPGAINGQRIDTGHVYAGPAVPALTNVQQVENDFLYKIEQGKYYGHPDPSRGEYVMDGGNPTAGTDPFEITAYPVGTQPDTNYAINDIYDLGPHRSADGIIQYQDVTFGGKLQGALLIANYSAGSDISAVTLDSSGNITGNVHGIPGLTGFGNPVNLCEDPSNGNIYVAELGSMQLTLVRPSIPGAHVSTSASQLAFSSVAAGNTGAAASAPQTVTVTNTGSDTLTFGAGAFTVGNDSSVSTQDKNAFSITGTPTSIAAGQSASFQVTFTAARVGIASAVLQIASNDVSGNPTSISLRGIGTAGQFSNLEPSLQRVLDLYKIPINMGDSTPNATAFPTPPTTPNDEIYAPRFVKASAGPVTVDVLAAFALGSPVAEKFGYYTPGSAASKNELFSISTAQEQMVDPTPQGATSFDPGNVAFGLYDQFPHFIDNGQERTAYSEDSLNTWDTTVSRKMRTYPLKNSDGAVVPNAYVVAFEDYNLAYDSNDLVEIIRNVTPLTAGPSLSLQNPAAIPFSDRLIFNRIQIPNTTVGDTVHDTNGITLSNSGEQPLTISSLTLSDTTNWTLVTPPQLPFTIAPGASQSLTIKFIATKVPTVPYNETNDTVTTEPGVSPTQAGGVYTGTLTIGSDDATQPAKAVTLAGYWQHVSAQEEEPSFQTIVNLLAGYQTNIAAAGTPQLTQAKTVKLYGEEVASGLWQAADSTRPVTVQLLDAFHNQGLTSNTAWYKQGVTTSTSLFKQTPDEGQSLLPHITGTANLAQASFTPGGVFGWNIDGEKSEDALNTVDINTYGRSGHQVRFYPLRDRSGNVIPNAWLIGMDYGNSEFDNDDYQDLAYIVTNMRPSTTPPTPTGFQSTLTTGGVTLQWEPGTYPANLAYNVYRSASVNGTLTKLNATALTTTSYIDTTAAVGATWYYQVKAIDTSNSHLSPGAGSSVNLTTAVGTAPSVPVTPANVQAFGGLDAVTLTWAPSPGATAYFVERLGIGDSDFAQIASSLTATTFADTSATPGSTYSYRIRAQNAVGFSPYSGTVTGTRGSQQTSSGTDVSIDPTVKKLLFVDGDGTLATVMLKLGAATLHFDGTAITSTNVKGIVTVAGTDLVLTGLAATGTTTNSVLTVTTKGGDGLISVGSISTDGSFKAINAKTTNFTGDLSVTGSLGKVVLNSVSGGTISTGVAGPALSVQVATASGETLTAAGVIALVKAAVWNTSIINAPLVRKFVVTQDASFTLNAGSATTINIHGPLHDSTLNLTGPLGKVPDLGTLTAGSMSGTTINSAGNIRSITTGSLLNSRIYVGVGTLSAGQILPAAASDFTSAAVISNVKVRHVKGIATYINSSIAASAITKADLGTIAFSNNATAFGVSSQFIKSLTANDSITNQHLVLKKVIDSATLTAELTAEAFNLQDMVIRIV